MKRTIPTTQYSILLTVFLYALTTSAQQFQWAKRGGSTNTLQKTADYNNVIEMTTDEADNIYMLCRVGASNLQVDGNPLVAYNAIATGARPDILLTSFTSRGHHRWSKVIGGGGNNGIGLKVSKGFVNLSGWASANDTAFYDTDTVIVDTSNNYEEKQLFLIQYDTAGTFNWMAMPESDTIAQSDFGGLPYWIDVAPNGDIYWLCYLKPGALPGTGQTVTTEGTYVLKYNQNGQFQSQVQLDVQQYGLSRLDGAYNEGTFIRDHQTGNFYLGGTHDYTGTFLIGGDTIKNRMYLAAFDNTGQVLWSRVGGSTSFSNDNINDFKIDPQGNLYLTGETSDGSSFNGYTFSSPKAFSTPFIMKMDGQGNLIWAKTAVALAGTPAHNITLNGNEAAIAGLALAFTGKAPTTVIL